MVAKDMINQAAEKCPSSKIFVAGYSQGAMVVRNGVAYANDAAKAKVKVCVMILSTYRLEMLTFAGCDCIRGSVPGRTD